MRGRLNVFRTLAFAIIFCGVALVVNTQMPLAEAIAASGAFDGKLYTNRALDLTILAPGGWDFYTPQQNEVAESKNRDAAFKSTDFTLHDSAANTQVLFQTTAPKALSKGKPAVLSVGIERLTASVTAKYYIEKNKKLVLASSNAKLTKDIYSVTYGGLAFSAFEVEGTSDGLAYRQIYLATVRKNIAIFFVSTQYDAKQDFAVAVSLKTIKFGK